LGGTSGHVGFLHNLSVELGNELMLGTGRTTLSQFKVSVE